MDGQIPTPDTKMTQNSLLNPQKGLPSSQINSPFRASNMQAVDSSNTTTTTAKPKPISTFNSSNQNREIPITPSQFYQNNNSLPFLNNVGVNPQKSLPPSSFPSASSISTSFPMNANIGLSSQQDNFKNNSQSINGSDSNRRNSKNSVILPKVDNLTGYAAVPGSGERKRKLEDDFSHSNKDIKIAKTSREETDENKMIVRLPNQKNDFAKNGSNMHAVNIRTNKSIEESISSSSSSSSTPIVNSPSMYDSDKQNRKSKSSAGRTEVSRATPKSDDDIIRQPGPNFVDSVQPVKNSIELNVDNDSNRSSPTPSADSARTEVTAGVVKKRGRGRPRKHTADSNDGKTSSESRSSNKHEISQPPHDANEQTVILSFDGLLDGSSPNQLNGALSSSYDNKTVSVRKPRWMANLGVDGMDIEKASSQESSKTDEEKDLQKMNDNDDASESLKSKSKSKSSFKFGIRSRGRGRPKKINIREIDDMVGRGIPPPNDDDLKDYHHDGTIDGILFANIRRWQPENYQLYKDMPPRRREMLGKKYFTCQIQRRLKLRFRKEILPEYMEVMNEKYKWLLDSVAKSTLCSEGTNPARWHSQGERLIKPRPLKQVPNDSVGKNSTSNQNSASASTSLRKMLLSNEDSGLGNSSGNVSRIDELLTISSGGSDDSSGSKHHYGPQSSELTSALKRALADVEPNIPNKRTNRSASPKSPPNRDDSQEEESSEDESEESEDARETVPRRKSRKRSTNSSRSSLPISTTRIAFHDLFSTTQNDPLFFKKEPKFQQIAGRKLNRRLPREFTYIALDDSAKPPQIYIVFGDMEVYAEFDDLTHPLKNYFMDSMKQLLPKRGNDSKFMEVWKAVMEKEKKPPQRRERSSASSAVSSRAQTRKSSPAVISALKNRQEDVPLSNNNFSKPFPPGLRPSESTDFSQILEKGNVSSSFDGRPSRRRNSDTNAATIPNISITEYSASSLRASPSASSIASSSSDDDSTLADVIPNDDSRYLDVLFNNHRSTLNRFTGVMDLQVEEFKTMYKKFAIENFRLRKEIKELKEQNLALLAVGGRDSESNGDNENLIRKIQELQDEVEILRKSVDEKDRSLTEVKKALGL